MLPKAISRTLTRPRLFHSSAAAKRVVAANPVKAQEVKV
jgi:succinate dehydrogenase (ubiquinone) flavoprotein subunit